MWGSDNKDRKKQAGITLIANNCEVDGDVRFTDQLQVNGYVKGNVIADESSNAKVTVSEHGCVEGEIRAPNVLINGEVMGDIHSHKHVELSAKARIKGSVYYNLVEMVLGARVEGNLHHVTGLQQEELEKNVAPRRNVEPEASAGDLPEESEPQTLVQPLAGG